MSITTNLDNIEYFALNLSDLTKLSPVELLLVKNKISSRELIHLNGNVDGTIILLRSNIREFDYRNSHKEKQKTQLKATCELLWKYNNVRTYYSMNCKKWHQFKF